VVALQWSHQMTGLWAVFCAFCPQVRLQLGPIVGHYQFVQGDPICCCFWQVAAAFPYSYNFGWSSSFPARWGNSVLWTPFSPTETSSEICHTSNLGCWLASPTLLSAFSPCPTPPSPRLIQYSTQLPMSVVD
jgi:hypothetical protein